jgi:hypothetical protein
MMTKLDTDELDIDDFEVPLKGGIELDLPDTEEILCDARDLCEVLIQRKLPKELSRRVQALYQRLEEVLGYYDLH